MPTEETLKKVDRYFAEVCTMMIGQKVRYKDLQDPFSEGSEYHRLMTVTNKRNRYLKAVYEEDADEVWEDIQTDVTGARWINADCVYVTDK
jgi:hypothetical protein